jgi:hypothetical protein
VKVTCAALQKLEEWDSMGSFLYHKIWGWPYTTDEEGKKTVAIPTNPSTEPIWVENVRTIIFRGCSGHIER